MAIIYRRLTIFICAPVLVFVVVCNWNYAKYGTLTAPNPFVRAFNRTQINQPTAAPLLEDKGRRPSILCLILTSTASKTKMAAVNSTWSRRCDRKYFLHDNTIGNSSERDILRLPVKKGRYHLTGKVRLALEHVYVKHKDSFDWILKCDDDTYVIMENLRHMLSQSSPTEPSYLGFHMKLHSPRGYMSGGGGYVISSSALRNLVTRGFQSAACKQDGGNEDVEIGKCLHASGVSTLSSLDTDDRETFHAESLFHHLRNTANNSWLPGYARNKQTFGSACCSRYSVSFHYVKPNEMYVFEHLLYNTSVYRGSTNRVIFNPRTVFPAIRLPILTSPKRGLMDGDHHN